MIAISLMSLVSADQAMAGNAGAAFVGGLVGGAIGAAMSNRSYSAPRARRSKPATSPTRKKQAPRAAAVAAVPWMAMPTPSGGMSVSNGEGVTFTYGEKGEPVLIVRPSTFVPPAALNSVVPLSVVVDGHAFAVLQADVRENGLLVDDVQVIALEQQLKPAHKASFASAFATMDITLSGFTKSIEQLEMMRQQMIILAATNPEKAKLVAQGNLSQSTTVVQVQVNGAQASGQPQPAADEASAAAPQATQVAANGTTVSIDVGDADAVNRQIGELSAEIAILTKVLTEQKDELTRATDADDKLTLDETIAAIASHIDELEQKYDAENARFEVYLTSVKPNDKDLYMTARKASQVFPKVPYYIPGTREQGVFWLEPKVTNVGELMFNFRLVDPAAENETTRDLIEVNLDQLENIRNALVKLRKNSTVAHENKIRKIYAKRVICFPVEQCPAEHQNGEKGKSSTEVVFLIYEDGATAGRLQLNKGAFQDGVNFSVDSALLLQAYLAHVIKEAKLEFKSGTQTTKDLDQLFQ
ncbi:hypothetical protein [Aestuariivirga litoralis]|nr:hypothetical protein [Aestuariivirga litoralis]